MFGQQFGRIDDRLTSLGNGISTLGYELQGNIAGLGKEMAKKCMVMVFVLIANRLDIVMGTSYIRDAVCIAYIVNELVSIIENAGLMGVPVPEVVMNAIDALKQKKE